MSPIVSVHSLALASESVGIKMRGFMSVRVCMLSHSAELLTHPGNGNSPLLRVQFSSEGAENDSSNLFILLQMAHTHPQIVLCVTLHLREPIAAPLKC